MDSISVAIKARDSRCRYWAKIVKFDDLPNPIDTKKANDLPGPFLSKGNEELFHGEFLFEGEENHHRKQRGWSYWITFIHNNHKIIIMNPNADMKKAFKNAGMTNEHFLKGSGYLAACVRVAKASINMDNNFFNEHIEFE